VIAAPVMVPAPSGQAGEALLLHDATPIRLRLNRTLSSAEAKTGDTVDFDVLEDVMVGDVTVVSRGSTAIGTITDAEKKRRMARGGKLDLEIDYVRLANGDRVALRAVKETSGGGHTGGMVGGMVATAIVVWPAAPFFLFMHGKDTTIPKGTEITAYTNGEIKLDSARFVAPQRLLPAASSKNGPTGLGGPSLTNHDVIALKTAGLSDEVIVVKIKSSPASYNLDVNGLLDLKKANLSDAVIAAMLQAETR
jgi:hypothetical protein